MDAGWKSTAMFSAVLTAAAILRGSGMSTEGAAAEAIKLALCLQDDTWQVGKEAVDVYQPF